VNPLAALALLENSIKLALAIADAVHDAKLVDMGASLAIRASLQDGLSRIAAANKAAAAVVDSPEAIANDPNNLDRGL